MDVYVSVSWALPLGLVSDEAPPLPDGWTAEARRTDYGLTGWRVRTFLLREGFRVARAARRHRALVLCTGGIETVAAGLASLVLAPRQRRVALDFLMPTSARADAVFGVALRPWHLFGCIRSNDRTVLERRFGVGRDRSAFVAFPAAADGLSRPAETAEDGYVYAAGNAHRDWPTFLRAAVRVEAPVVVCIGVGPLPPEATGLPARIDLRGPDRPIAPTEGRALAARASVVVVPMLATDLPAGPLVLLDAMALGKAVVATASPGVVDYATDGVDALLVPTGDDAAMAAAIERLLGDSTLRERIGQAAAARTAGLDREHFLAALASLVAPTG